MTSHIQSHPAHATCKTCQQDPCICELMAYMDIGIDGDPECHFCDADADEWRRDTSGDTDDPITRAMSKVVLARAAHTEAAENIIESRTQGASTP